MATACTDSHSQSPTRPAPLHETDVGPKSLSYTGPVSVSSKSSYAPSCKDREANSNFDTKLINDHAHDSASEQSGTAVLADHNNHASSSHSGPFSFPLSHPSAASHKNKSPPDTSSTSRKHVQVQVHHGNENRSGCTGTFTRSSEHLTRHSREMRELNSSTSSPSNSPDVTVDILSSTSIPAKGKRPSLTEHPSESELESAPTSSRRTVVDSDSCNTATTTSQDATTHTNMSSSDASTAKSRSSPLNTLVSAMEAEAEANANTTAGTSATADADANQQTDPETDISFTDRIEIESPIQGEGSGLLRMISSSSASTTSHDDDDDEFEVDEDEDDIEVEDEDGTQQEEGHDYNVVENYSTPSSPRNDARTRTRARFQNYTFNTTHRISVTSYQANDPCEDRYASLTNVLLQETSNHPHSQPLSHQGPIRLSLFAVLDGHGGAAVAEFASRKLLPLLVRNISSRLACEVIQNGLFHANGQTIEWNKTASASDDDVGANQHPNEHDDGLDSEEDLSDDDEMNDDEEDWYKAPDRKSNLFTSSSASTLTSTPELDFVIGTHSKQERSVITGAIQESYLQMDEEWINFISRRGSQKQAFLIHNGKWNSGACCLVNIVLQRMDADANQDGDLDKEGEMYQHHEAILYSSHTGDCRAVLLRGDPTSNFDLDGEDVNSDLSSRNSNSSSDGDDDHEHDDEDGQEGSEQDQDARGSVNDDDAAFNEVMFEKIQGTKRPLLNPFNTSANANARTNRGYKRRRLWNQFHVENLDEVDSPARIQSLLHPMTTNLEEEFQETRRNGLDNLCSRSVTSLPFNNVMSRLCSRSPSPLELPPQPSPMPKLLLATTLTEDHTPYNAKEASLVRERCNYAPRAIATSTNGGIQRVAGSLSVTRALGDAYLKTPRLSFDPYKAHAPYISALPEVSSRVLSSDDRVLILASDGVWERVDGDKMAQWVGDYYKWNKGYNVSCGSGRSSPSGSVDSSRSAKRPTLSRRMRMLPTRKSISTIKQEELNSRILNMTNVSDMIVSKVLNRVRRKYKLPNLTSLMDLPKGSPRRMKHDDITALVVDLEGFTSM